MGNVGWWRGRMMYACHQTVVRHRQCHEATVKAVGGGSEQGGHKVGWQRLPDL